MNETTLPYNELQPTSSVSPDTTTENTTCPPTLLRLEQVRFSYNEGSPLFDGLDFSLSQNDYLALIGPNGSGKSTLALIMAGLLIPEQGRLQAFGHNITGDQDRFEMRSSLGMVFQNPDDQLVASIVEDEVAFGPENLGVPRDEIERRVSTALEAVGLSSLRTAAVETLSGGQKQRLAIASALAMQPRVLILDEATAMLDPQGRRGVLDVIARLHEEGMAIVTITHDMDEAALATRVVVLDRGRIVGDTTPRDLFTREALPREGRTGSPVRDVDLLSRAVSDDFPMAPAGTVSDGSPTHDFEELPFAPRICRRLQERGIDVPPCLDVETLEEELWRLYTNR